MCVSRHLPSLHLNIGMWAWGLCLDTYERKQNCCDWRWRRIFSDVSILCYQRQKSISLWTTTGNVTVGIHSHKIHTRTIHRNIQNNMSVSCWLSGCHFSVCECVWRPFSTTQGAVLTVHSARTDLWPLYAARSPAPGYSIMQIYTLDSATVYHPDAILIQLDLTETFVENWWGEITAKINSQN